MKMIIWLIQAAVFGVGLLTLLPLYVLNMVGPYEGSATRTARIDRIAVRWHGFIFSDPRA